MKKKSDFPPGWITSYNPKTGQSYVTSPLGDRFERITLTNPTVPWTFTQTGLHESPVVNMSSGTAPSPWLTLRLPFAAEAFFFGVLLGLLITLIVCRKVIFK